MASLSPPDMVIMGARGMLGTCTNPSLFTPFFHNRPWPEMSHAEIHDVTVSTAGRPGRRRRLLRGSSCRRREKQKNRFLQCNNRVPPQPRRARRAEDSGSKKHSEITVVLWAIQRVGAQKNPCAVNPPRRRRRGAVGKQVSVDRRIYEPHTKAAARRSAAAVPGSNDVQIPRFRA